MNKKVVIFGNGKIAEVVAYYAINECKLDVVAFTCDKEFIKEPTFLELPLVDFEKVTELYPANQFDMFVAVGYQDMNKLRETKCNQAIEKGYELISVVSPPANVPKNVKIGKNCFIMSPSLIHPCVEIGNNTFVWSGAMLGHHSKIGENCWFTSTANISGNVTVGKNCFFAVNSTVGHSVTIGDNCFLGANALVVKNLESDKVVIEQATEISRLSTNQFLKISKFSSL